MLKRVPATIMLIAAVGWCAAFDAAAQPALADHRLMVSEHTVVREIGSKLNGMFVPVAIRSATVPDSLSVGEDALFFAHVNVEHATLPITPRWEFSDGRVLTGLSVRRTFTDPGRYTVNFHVENRGSEASRKFEVVVHQNDRGDLSEQHDENGCDCE